MESKLMSARRGLWSSLWSHLKPQARPGVETGGQGLHEGSLWSRRIQGDEGLLLTCTEGRLWLTFESDPRDYVLERGSSVPLDHGGQVVVQALRSARFCLGTSLSPCGG
ncbi:DUF2917 domain-containing protein [Myxococcus sp. AB025B]|uniref:DUF2917 domain-containing protein n=1 Tax=Myxococcus sp. AB025B TaxID=2562794 RepID=UPI001144BF6B|nr:DUF2917 domain-containing protein [Myxococcus sp. AB025B]